MDTPGLRGASIAQRNGQWHGPPDTPSAQAQIR
jgi:hypothetical protein